MARLATIDAAKLLNVNPRLMDFLTFLTTPISIKLLDVTVLPNATEARLKLQLSGEIRDSVIVSYQTRNGVNTNQGSQYIASNGTIVFQPGDPIEQEIVIALKGNNSPGNTIEVYLLNNTGAKLEKSSGWITFSTDPTQIIPSGFVLDWQTDFFMNNFAFSDTGKLPDGTPCWQSRPAHGRTQDGNAELGLYSDPTLYPQTNPFPIIDGKRRLRSEKLSAPITYNSKSWNYTAAMITSRFLPPLTVGGRVECRLAMPLTISGSRGAWPAFWLMPTSGAWPPEIDMMEWPIRPDANMFRYYSTQHWVNSNNNPTQLGYPIDTKVIGSTVDLRDFHVYGVTITEEALLFDFDGIKTLEMENRSPNDSWYVLLNIAMGGSWPGNPTSGTIFPCDMILDWLKLYKAA